MTSFNLYFLTHDSKMLSTYANRNLVIGSRSIDTMHSLKNFMVFHNLKYGRWINDFVNLSFKDEYDSELKMRTNSNYSSHILTISSVNFATKYKTENSFIMDILMTHSDVFIVDDFEYNRTNDILSLQGLCFQSTNVFDEEFNGNLEYLKRCFRCKRF
jgi:hypothetical protein